MRWTLRSSRIGPGRLCLPVSDALVAAAAGKDLVLVREGEKVEGSKLVGSRVCGDVPMFSLFAVGYENPVMAFPVETKDFDFRTGREESMPCRRWIGGIRRSPTR